MSQVSFEHGSEGARRASDSVVAEQIRRGSFFDVEEDFFAGSSRSLIFPKAYVVYQSAQLDGYCVCGKLTTT